MTAPARRFKARPLNRKVSIQVELFEMLYKKTVLFFQNKIKYYFVLQILEAPSFPLPKKSTPKLPEFQVSAWAGFCLFLFLSIISRAVLRLWVLLQYRKTLQKKEAFVLYLVLRNASIASQEFHLKTLERAMQHNSSVSSSSFQCNDSNKVYLDSLKSWLLTQLKTVFVTGSNLVDNMMRTVFGGILCLS